MPITAASIRFQDYQFQTVVSSGTWRWTTRMDVSGPAPIFTIRDIITPFGILVDTVALPGEVVTDMGESISEIQTNFPPTIFVGPPSDLTFTVDEGRGFSATQDAQLTNTGVFGSLLNATLASSAAYVTVTPANLGNLASNESGTFSVAVDSTTLLATQSPLAESITVQDAAAGNSPQSLPLTIIIRPKATIQVTPAQLNFVASKPVTGPFPPIPSQTFTIENTGPAGSVLDYQVQRLTDLSNDWLTGFSPASGTLVSGGTQLVTVQVAPIEALGIGTFTEVLRISGFSSNLQVDITIQLIIS